jgi:hypothetical protein
MTIHEAISYIDSVKPNKFPQNTKIAWLSGLDGVIKKEVIDTHEGGEDIKYSPYTANTPMSISLIIEHPYDDIYTKFLEMQIDYYNGEYARYSNSRIVYNDAYEEWVKYYNANHVPKSKGTWKHF